MNTINPNVARNGADNDPLNYHTGGFGDYVDFKVRLLPFCISHDYTDRITCWHLTPGGAPATAPAEWRRYQTGWPIRALTGYYESSFFAVCGRKYIKVFNIWEGTTPSAAPPAYNSNHVAIHIEGTTGGPANLAGLDILGSIVNNDFNH